MDASQAPARLVQTPAPSSHWGLDLTAPEFLADPYPAYRRLLREFPVCRDGPSNTWFVSRHADVHTLLRDPRLSSDQLDIYMERLPAEERAAAAPLRDVLTHRLLLTDNPTHHRIRGLIQQAFTPRRIEAMRHIIQETIDDLLDRVESAGRMDLIGAFADPLPSRIIAGMLGLPPEERGRYKAWTDDIYAFMGLSAAPVGERARQATASVRQLTAHLGDVFAAVRRQPRDDLLSALVAAREQEDRLTETELFSNVVGLINGSHETTTNLIGNTVLTLLQNPEQRERLAAEPGLLANAVEEGLRYESPIQMISRRASEDVRIGAVTVQRGERVAFLVGAANRDPEVFSDPDRFDVTRPEIKHLAFGGGPHFCIGAALGRLEGQLAIESVFRRFPRLRLAKAEVCWRPYPVFRGLRALPVEWA